MSLCVTFTYLLSPVIEFTVPCIRILPVLTLNTYYRLYGSLYQGLDGISLEHSYYRGSLYHGLDGINLEHLFFFHGSLYQDFAGADLEHLISSLRFLVSGANGSAYAFIIEIS